MLGNVKYEGQGFVGIFVRYQSSSQADSSSSVGGPLYFDVWLKKFTKSPSQCSMPPSNTGAIQVSIKIRISAARGLITVWRQQLVAFQHREFRLGEPREGEEAQRDQEHDGVGNGRSLDALLPLPQDGLATCQIAIPLAIIAGLDDTVALVLVCHVALVWTFCRQGRSDGRRSSRRGCGRGRSTLEKAQAVLCNVSGVGSGWAGLLSDVGDASDPWR